MSKRKKKPEVQCIVAREADEELLELFSKLLPQTTIVSSEVFDWLVEVLEEEPRELPRLKELLSKPSVFEVPDE